MPRKLLLLESQAIIALDLAERVRAMGWLPCGPYASTEEALAGLRATEPDAALLDLTHREAARAEPVADALAARGVPFIFTNSHGKSYEAVHPGAPRLDKPFTDADFQAAVTVLEASGALARAAEGPREDENREPPAPV
ncbi:MAG: response regulator [Oceanicaulis sp.]